jgi:hypothetical protein
LASVLLIQDYIKKIVDKGNTRLSPFLLQANFNNEFICGRQFKRIDPKKMAIVDKENPGGVYMEKKVFNRILPIYLTRYGILTQNMPVPGIKPIRNNSSELDSAVKINAFILDFMNKSEFKNNIYNKAIKHADVAGIEWFKTGIDWSDGNPIAEINTVINGEKGYITLKEGRPYVMAVPIYEIFIDNYNVESMDEVNELVHRRAFPLTYIKARWGIEAAKENVSQAGLTSYPKFNNISNVMTDEIEQAYVYEYYKKPDAVYPKGRYIVMCNNKILYDNDLPYENTSNGERKIPFDFVTMQSVPNHLIGVTVYSQLIPIQETFNAIKNRYLEYMNHIAIGQLYVWEGSLVNKDNFTTAPGKLISIKRNQRPPETVKKDRISMEFINYLKSLEDDMLITAGLSQMTAYGVAKSNVRTDGVVDKLSESDENKLVNALDNLSDMMIRIFKKIINLEKQRQKELHEQLKIAKVGLPTYQYNLADVDTEMLAIVNREFLMQSDQMLDKKLQQAVSFGLYNPQTQMSFQSKIELLTSMKANYLVDTLDPMERSTYNLCEEEHYDILHKMLIPPVEDYHVHAQHLVAHNLFRISPEIRKLMHEDNEKFLKLQEAISEHVKAHEGYLEQSREQNPQISEHAKARFNTAGSRQGY